jgi:predicted ferric reductase
VWRGGGINRFIQGPFWIGVYLLLTLAPLFLLLVDLTPPGRSFWTEFSIAIGFAGMAIMGTQCLITARFRHLTSPTAWISCTTSSGKSPGWRW